MLASAASESPGKTRCESQIPLSSWNEQQPRTVRPVMDACSSNYSEWNVDKTLMEDRTVRPVNKQPLRLFTQHADRFIVDDDDMDSNTVVESDMSLKSRSFLHRVNDRVRKMLDRSSKYATQDSNKHSLIWRMFMSSTLQASVFVGKEHSENLRSIKKTGNNLTMKQIFDISEKLIAGQSDEIYGVTPIDWEDSSWKQLSLVGDEEVISLSHKGLRIFRFCVMPWKDPPEPTI